ncbi:MAG: translation elongation factor Ts [Anaerolineae bacterium]|nr:translation elongation factor Ts [Anaerolineae bacterium]
MQITAQMVKDLRDQTGAGPLDCKKALTEFDGDVTKAIEYLREKGLAKAAKKVGRATNEGLIAMYQHHNKRIGVMLELNCETDFVAATPQFEELARGLTLHIANLAPKVVRIEDVPEALIADEKKIQRARALEEGKPEHIVDKIVEGRMGKFYEDIVLLEQAYLLNDEQTVAAVIQEAIAELGENIQVARFTRYEIGEALDGEAEG